MSVNLEDAMMRAEDAASTFECEGCGLRLNPTGDIKESTVDEMRRVGFLCEFCGSRPDEFTGEGYKNYLVSDTWKGIRSAAIQRAGGCCQICNSDLMLNVHHRRYPKVLGEELPMDLTVLCRRCHDLFHNARRPV
jgi:hypothetical protein